MDQNILNTLNWLHKTAQSYTRNSELHLKWSEVAQRLMCPSSRNKKNPSNINHMAKYLLYDGYLKRWNSFLYWQQKLDIILIHWLNCSELRKSAFEQRPVMQKTPNPDNSRFSRPQNPDKQILSNPKSGHLNFCNISLPQLNYTRLSQI